MSQWEDLIQRWVNDVNKCSVNYQDQDEDDDYYSYHYSRDAILEADDVREQLKPLDDVEPAVMESRVQNAIMQLLKGYLDHEPAFNSQFVSQTPWKWLNQLLLAARIKELAGVKVVRKGRRSGMGYDITELVGSYYGRQILQTLNFNVSRKRVVNKDEFELIGKACEKIKLKLPEVVQPTTTEQFFSQDKESQ